jgi:hypothetical protein
MKIYFEGTGKFQSDYDRLWDKLVPSSGEAATRHGEAIRAIGRFSHDIYNNGGGNIHACDHGWGMNPYYGKLASYLESFMSDALLYNRLSSIARAAAQDWEHTAELFEPIMDSVIAKATEMDLRQES